MTLQPDLVTHALFLSLISVIAAIDFKNQLIPNRLILLSIVVWGVLAWLGFVSFADPLLPAISAVLTLLLIRWTGFWLYQKPGMGMGDVKLLFVMGLFLEWEVFWALYLAITAGGVWAIAGIWLKSIDIKSRLPFAPFLLVGSLLAIFFFPFNRFLELWV